MWSPRATATGLVLDGFSLRVFKNGEITEAFKTYHHLMQCLDDYPILDEDDYSDREFEATVENINDAAWKLKGEFDLPQGWDIRSLLVALRQSLQRNRERR